jgi:uncharacterized repeat protein (TIGR01451 family)
MLPAIQDGDVLHVAPVGASQLRCGEILLVEGDGSTEDSSKLWAHRLISKNLCGDRFVTQGDASQEPDAPVRAHQILGRVIAKESVIQRVMVEAVKTKELTMNGIGGQGGERGEVQREVQNPEVQKKVRRVELHGLRAQARRRVTQARSVAAGWVKSALGVRPSAGAGAALSLLLLCLGAVPASAQVAVDITAAAGFGGATTTSGSNFTFTHTTGGSNRIMLVGVAMNIANNSAATVGSITYAGVPLTFLSAHNNSTNTRRVEMWFRLPPALGANTVSVTMSAFGAGTVGVGAGSVTFTGVDQTDPLSVLVSKDDLGTASTTSVLDVPSAISEFVYAVAASAGNASQTKFGPEVQQWQGFSGTGSNLPPDVFAAGYTLAGAPSVPVPITYSASTNWSVGGVSIHPLNADMGVTVATTGAIFAGGQTTYTIKVQNNGWSDAANVSLSFPLAATETFVSSASTKGSCAGTMTVTCTLGTVASHFNATITIKANIAAAGNYTTTATVSSTTTDLYMSNNTFTTTVPVQIVVCATPGNDGPGGTLTGVVNTYYPGTADAASAAPSISVGTSTGAATAIANGDLLLVMQMQDAAISPTNGVTYGDGIAGSGWTNLNAAGAFEYVRATSAVVAGVVTIAGAGPSGGLIYSYTNAAASTTQGQRRFQVIRVPQYSTATLGATLTALAWNGTTGGVLAIDVSDTLTLNSVTVSVNGLGFRGAGGLQLSGSAGGANTDFQTASPAGITGAGFHGSKGEGIAGTPVWLDNGTTAVASGSTYPSGVAAVDGSMARGAPGNAGGGGTDANPSANDQNSGGGGGANGGAGGEGGNSWLADTPIGGLPGVEFPGSINRIVMGGGGGAGSRNNSAGRASAGGAGGGIVMIRAGLLSGAATITANGNPGVAPPTTANDGGGGGGAGGSIVVLSQAGGTNGLTLNVNGGAGGSTNAIAFTGFGTEPHGPGGGGGGGVIISSGGLAASNRVGGQNGKTSASLLNWGATAGAAGSPLVNSAKLSQVAGTRGGSECPAADCVVAKSHVGNFVRGTATNDYKIVVSNISPSTATVGLVTVVDTLPAPLTATVMSGTGWTCDVPTLTCTRSDALAPLGSYPVRLARAPIA